MKDICFWIEYDRILQGFIDFYRTFLPRFPPVTRLYPRMPCFPEQIERTLLFNNDFLKTAKKVRDRCIKDAKYANAIRWQPALSS